MPKIPNPANEKMRVELAIKQTAAIDKIPYDPETKSECKKDKEEIEIKERD
jgi:hypothetical protein